MNTRISIVLLVVCFLSCSTNREENTKNANKTSGSEIAFHKEKWRAKEGKDYPFREGMLNDIVYNDTIRSQSKEEILGLLGEPDRINEEYLYYMVSQTRLGFWAIRTKTLVIKFSDNYEIEWIKIHD